MGSGEGGGGKEYHDGRVQKMPVTQEEALLGVGVLVRQTAVRQMGIKKTLNFLCSRHPKETLQQLCGAVNNCHEPHSFTKDQRPYITCPGSRSQTAALVGRRNIWLVLVSQDLMRALRCQDTTRGF